ncbi:MAG TPA: ABC transporter permease, partial [Glaciihabitans sp.]|nr:ABC transporter permease [Glaciihabitans sp.]
MTIIESPPASTASAGLGSGRGRVWKQLLSNPLGVTGGIMLLVVVIIAIIAPWVAPHGPAEVHFDAPFQAPGTVGYLLGTDDLGRDILSRMMYGIRVSLQVGILSVLLAVVVGTPLGLLAGYWRWLDGIISRLTDVTLAFPFLIIAVGLAAISGPSLSNAAIALGVAQVPTMIRVVRGETLRIKESDFVMSASTMNASGIR